MYQKTENIVVCWYSWSCKRWRSCEEYPPFTVTPAIITVFDTMELSQKGKTMGLSQILVVCVSHSKYYKYLKHFKNVEFKIPLITGRNPQ